MDAEKILIYIDLVGAIFAGTTVILRLAGLDETKLGKAWKAVSIDVIGAAKALRKKP
jgi:hypothetical protein